MRWCPISVVPIGDVLSVRQLAGQPFPNRMMSSIFWIPQGCQPAETVRYGDSDWAFVGDRHADFQLWELADSRTWASPLLLIGDSGHGKTLLARSLTRTYQRSLTGPGTRFVTGNDLKRSLHQAIDTQTLPQWRDQYLQLNWVVIDGLEQLLDDHTTQRSLETLLDGWNDSGTAVLITATAPPSRLLGITERLASRCVEGQRVTVRPPGPAARRWLIRRFLSERGMSTEGDHVRQLDDWCEQTHPAVPVVRGLIGELASRATTTDPSHLETLLLRLLRRRASSQPTIDEIARLVARRYAVPLRDLRGGSRRRATVRARSAAMWLARKWTACSYQRIGEYFHGRDHTTVLHACRSFEKQLSDLALRQTVELMESELRQNGARCPAGGKRVPTTSMDARTSHRSHTEGQPAMKL